MKTIKNKLTAIFRILFHDKYFLITHEGNSLWYIQDMEYKNVILKSFESVQEHFRVEELEQEIKQIIQSDVSHNS